MTTAFALSTPTVVDDTALFERIVDDLCDKGLSIQPCALPTSLSLSLQAQVLQMHAQHFDQAGIGRSQDFMQNIFVRRDKIRWIDGETQAGQLWLDWTEKLRLYINRQLFMGLFSFESHFAHYPKGAFYKRHLDSFKGAANRVLSVVTYLNNDWQPEHGGELVLYKDEVDMIGTKVVPAMGTIAIFLSENFPHEVLAANRDRYSIAGWYRVNTNTAEELDPPK